MIHIHLIVNSVVHFVAKYIVSLGGIGFIKPASGTWGTLATMPIAYGIATVLSPIWLVCASFLAFFVGWIATTIYEKHTHTHDASEVVIDEMAGIFLTLAIIPVDIILYGIAFFVFRFFDIVKIFPANVIDKQKTPFSVMLDDIFAAIYAMIAVWFIWQYGGIEWIQTWT